uniref:Uncharacterized protein n=1 Tax=Manihot esculenta TaxID=3983 RepID=A0A199U9U7_MANES
MPLNTLLQMANFTSTAPRLLFITEVAPLLFISFTKRRPLTVILDPIAEEDNETSSQSSPPIACCLSPLRL